MTDIYIVVVVVLTIFKKVNLADFSTIDTLDIGQPSQL